MRIDACRIRFLQSIDIRTCQLTYRRCMMLNTFGGFFVLGILKGWKQSVGLLATISVFIILNSLQGHKESRFLAPIYPIIIIFSLLTDCNKLMFFFTRGNISSFLQDLHLLECYFPRFLLDSLTPVYIHTL